MYVRKPERVIDIDARLASTKAYENVTKIVFSEIGGKRVLGAPPPPFMDP